MQAPHAQTAAYCDEVMRRGIDKGSSTALLRLRFSIWWIPGPIDYEFITWIEDIATTSTAQEVAGEIREIWV